MNDLKIAVDYMEDQLSKLLPKRINNTMLYHNIGILDTSYKTEVVTVITVFNPEIQALRDKFHVALNLRNLPEEYWMEYMKDVWMKDMSEILIKLIIGINANDLTQLKEELRRDFT